MRTAEQRAIPARPERSSVFDSKLLEARLRREVTGDIYFDAFNRGRYSTDASIYQIEPAAVVVPASLNSLKAAIAICTDLGAPIVPRGGGTSQCGQTIGTGVVIDTSKHLNALLSVDAAAKTAVVQPGIVLDQLNKQLKKHGLFFPVDPSTASRATLGGMTANNSSGARSIEYGTMVDNVLAIEAILPSNESFRFGELPADLSALPDDGYGRIAKSLRDIGLREADEVALRFPKLLRRVGGYNIDTISPKGHNLAKVLIGSEGTLGFFTSIELRLADIPPHRMLAICHFPTFYAAMDATRHLVALQPSAVELVDRTMVDLSRNIPIFRPTIEKFVHGEPDALLLVEFSGSDASALTRKLDDVEGVMEGLHLSGAVVNLISNTDQSDIWNVRKAGLDIMSSMTGDGKPVSIVEDCAVGLADLAEFTQELNDMFERFGTKGTWYAHASVGCLHVRPVLNMKSAEDVAKFRGIAEEGFAIVRKYKGSHSGEHGDGILRSEFHAEMFGERLVRAFEDVKDAFDPNGVMNPGKIVRPLRMDDRTLFRYRPEYSALPLDTTLDWSAWPGGLSGAVEMCNNNGACRKDDGLMCPSYMVTKDEEHTTRGRANTLRLALSGQLGADALTSQAMYETLDLCVSCKGCRRECPTGVDMAKMKLEFLHRYRRKHGLGLKDRLVANLPRYAPALRRIAPLLQAGATSSVARHLAERVTGISARRTLPAWRRDVFDHWDPSSATSPTGAKDVVLLVDTFNTYFEPENAWAARDVLEAAGYNVIVPAPVDKRRPLCCGRTFLSAGLVDDARTEIRRSVATLQPYVAAGTPIVGLEPSCLLTFRDEALSVLPGAGTQALAKQAFLFEEFLVRELEAGRFALKLQALPGDTHRALLHGHCHQKAFGALTPAQRVLALIPRLKVETVQSSCCGMAGTFGYDAHHFDISMKMAELSLLPAVRAAGDSAFIVADGTSCRHQIHDGAHREAMHVARVLHSALTSSTERAKTR
ncbi:MAG TPA: FAD-linked oxidase C-terminal domain-containing protein [Candidatus Baltobacteraceae bacterium]